MNKELMEALKAVNELSLWLIQEIRKNGIGLVAVTDFWLKLQTDEEFKKMIIAGYTDINKVPSEIPAMGVREWADVVKLQIDYGVKIFELLKAAQAVPQVTA